MAHADITSTMNKMVLCTTGFLTCQKMTNLRRKWITDHLLVEIINESIHLSAIDKITTLELNRAVSTFYRNKIDILVLHVCNSHGVYKSSNEHRINDKRKRSTSYYFTNTINELPMMPNVTTIIYGTKESAEQPNCVTQKTLKTTHEISISHTPARRATKRTRLDTDSHTDKIEERSQNKKVNSSADVILAHKKMGLT